MATATLVKAGAHHLRYLIQAEGTGLENVDITTIGGATPDTLTDSVGAGVINKLSKVVADGYGAFPAGAQTTSKAAALWLSDLSGADPSSGSPNGAKLPTAKLYITPRDGVGRWIASGVAVANDPIVRATVDGGGSAYLDIIAPNTIGV